MAPSIRTLRDLERGSNSTAADDDTPTAPKNYKSHNRNVKIAHIPGLRDDNHAKSLLDRIYQEFLPLLQKRGYNVASVSEMCCCGDGKDHNNKGRQRKKKLMPHNVLGYNQTYFRGGYKSHTIHLRLRQPTNHDVFYDYESIAATMSHEMAHCEIGPHNAKFYKLMEEIQQQHAVFLTKGQVLDKDGFPMGSENAYTLGSNAGGKPQKTDSRKAALAAAVQRQKRQQQMTGGQRLGGTTGEFTKWLRPGEAAAQAAEERRLRDEVWCQPCEPEIIELSDDEDENDDDVVVEEKEERKPAAVPSSNAAGKENQKNDGKKAAKREAVFTQNETRQTSSVAKMPTDCVDLTGSDDEDAVALVRPPKQQRRTAIEWPCSTCTYRNAQLALVCAMCGANKKNVQSSLELAQKLQKEATDPPPAMTRQQQIDRVKDQEVAQSVRDFGFNIYGTDKEGR